MWPASSGAFIVGGGVSVNAESFFDGSTRSLWGVSAGTATADDQIYRESLCMRLTAGAATFSMRQTSGLMIYLPLTILTLGARFRYAEWQRVYRISHTFARNAFNAGTDSGVAFALYDGAAAGNYPSAVGAGAGFGIQGDGAGGWQWFSKPTVAGGFTDVTPLVWPSALTEWVRVDWELLVATPTTPAVVNLYLDSTLVVTRSWGPGTVLPDYAAIANANQWRYGMRAGSPNGLNLFLGSMIALSGRFTARDVELLNAENGSL